MRVSIITATRNCAATIADCLRSVSAQSWTEREHVVIDGASSDDTLAILESHRDAIDVLVSEPDTGIYDALNKGIARATGQVVGFLHADDVYASPNALERIVTAFADRSVGAVYGDVQYVEQADLTHVVRHWKSSRFSRRRLAWGWMPPHTTLYVRREWYERIGSFDTRYRIAADYFTILSLFSHATLNPVHIPEVLVKMRVGGTSNRSLSNLLQKSREDLHALRRSGVGGLGALAWKNVSKIGQWM